MLALAHHLPPTQSHAPVPNHDSMHDAAATAAAVQGFGINRGDSATRVVSSAPMREPPSTPRSENRTQHRKSRKVATLSGGRQLRQPFDARTLLAQHGDLDLGVHELAEMHLSQRQLQPGRYYTMLDVIDM